jgi:hypothetical protein
LEQAAAVAAVPNPILQQVTLEVLAVVVHFLVQYLLPKV